MESQGKLINALRLFRLLLLLRLFDSKLPSDQPIEMSITSQQLLDPATQAEAEMAATARACLMAGPPPS
jgi:hypothetical protein